jgi:hypothetical protein
MQQHRARGNPGPMLSLRRLLKGNACRSRRVAAAPRVCPAGGVENIFQPVFPNGQASIIFQQTRT